MQINVNELEHVFNPKSPNEFHALKGVTFSIKQGEYVGVIGQTGSGKTTLIEHLNALLLPSKGSINWIYSKDIYNKKLKEKQTIEESFTLQYSRRKKVKKAKELRQRVGVVFQFAEYQLFEETIEKDIAFGPRSFGVDKEEAQERAKKYLNLVGMDDSFLKKSPFNLSGGQKRRVALAGILAVEPDVIVADEPTAGLDPVGVKEILAIFKNLHKMGKTIIIVTHDLDNILSETHRVLLLKDGRIAKDGATYETLKDTKFLLENNMIPPKLLDFVAKLEEKGIKIPKVTTLEELAHYLNHKVLNKGDC